MYPRQQVFKVMYAVYCNLFCGHKLLVLEMIYEGFFIVSIRQT
jgi:hypothetical protein